MSVTIKDVAKAAGVSVSTVSKVINGWTSISEETTDRVKKVIQELHYIPNARAVSFARKSTTNIVFLTSLEKEEAYKNPHMFDIMCGVHNELSKYHYSVSLVDTSTESYPGECVEQTIADGSTAGIIIHGSALNDSIADLIVRNDFPHTVIGNPGFESKLCWVDTNHKLGGQFAAEHLLSKGYQRIAFIGGKKTDVISQQRLLGAKQTLARAGFRMDNSYILHTDSSLKSTREATIKLMQGLPKPEVIICENNFIAFGVSKTLERLGCKIPEDIAFLTFDRYPYTNIIEPSPTIIDIDVYDMGVQAASTLHRKLQNPSLLVQSYTTLPIIIQGETT